MPLARVTNPGVKPVWRRVRARGVAAHPAAALPLGAASHPGRPPPRGGAARRGRGRPGEGARRPRLRREPRGRGAAPGGGEAARCGAVPRLQPVASPGPPRAGEYRRAYRRAGTGGRGVSRPVCCPPPGVCSGVNAAAAAPPGGRGSRGCLGPQPAS